jgi:hypothetical protein
MSSLQMIQKLRVHESGFGIRSQQYKFTRDCLNRTSVSEFGTQRREYLPKSFGTWVLERQTLTEDSAWKQPLAHSRVELSCHQRCVSHGSSGTAGRQHYIKLAILPIPHSEWQVGMMQLHAIVKVGAVRALFPEKLLRGGGRGSISSHSNNLLQRKVRACS